MKNCLLMIDGGTTNTSFTLLEGERILARTKRKVGASNTVHANRNSQLEEAVRLEIESLQSRYNCRITDVYASGMITSNAGLREIPHLEAPATLADLAQAVQVHRLEAVSADLPFHFVPGIRIPRSKDNDPDMIRGEEVEILGAMEPGDSEKSLLFVHFGSHNKMIRCEKGAIVQATTTLSGELLWAVCNETILKSTVAELDGHFTPDPHYVRKGFRAAEKSGFSRSLFLARIGQVLEGFDRQQALSFVFGTLVHTDLAAFAPLLAKPADRLVLYGRDSFIAAFSACMELTEQTSALRDRLQIIPFEISQTLSVKGICQIHQYKQRMRT